MDVDESVVLLSADGRAIGIAPKASVHGADTPRHLAFSCHVQNAAGELLVTRRSLAKAAWPGVWTNAFCGHPGPAEAIPHAVHRRAGFELGLRLRELQLVLPLFQYRAVDASGIVEHELCPVYTAIADEEPEPNPAEVMDHAWVAPERLAAAVRAAPWAFSPWLVLQARLLPVLGGDPAAGIGAGTDETEALVS